MPIQPPSLDDRRFDDLVEEMIARIPAHTPEWTHPRQGDPGRTLIELFAWLADTLLYRANLVPERQRLVFLKLLGLGLKPARPARGIVSLAWAQERVLDRRTLAPQARLNAALPVETVAETTVLPVSGAAYIKRPLSAAEQARRSALLDGLAQIHGVAGPVQGYEVTPVFADGQPQPAEGIDVFGASADQALWIALLAPPAPRPAEQLGVNQRVLAALGGENGSAPALLSVGVVPALRPPGPFEQQLAGPGRPLPLWWEISTQGRSGADTDYLRLDIAPGSDSSAGLARAGVLRLGLPAAPLIWAPSNDVGLNRRAGVGDNPPRLDDAGRAARLVGWLRLRPQPGSGVARLPLAWVGLNAVEVQQCQSLGGQVLAGADGSADLQVDLPLGSVDADSLRIQVEETGYGYVDWERVDDLAALGANAQLGREARVYELDAEAGRLRFGDGLRGKVPEAGARIRLAAGRFGGGRAGNLPPRSLSQLAGRDIEGQPLPPLQVVQPLPLAGGEDAETLAAAERRIPALLRHRDRAVTEEDYRRLAPEAPGLDVGRVEVLPRFKPADRRFDMAGVVSVLALPAQAAGAPGTPCPRPDRLFIERLHAFLSARTPLATELYVIGADYVPLGVSVAVTVRDGHARDQVLLEVRQALARLLWPLAPGGIDRAGWGLGRPVRSRELEVEVARVAGVDEVNALRLYTRTNAGSSTTVSAGDTPAWQRLPQAGADGAMVLTLQRWQLPELLQVVAIEGRELPPGELRAMPNPYAQPGAVAVPVVPETC